MGIYFLPQLRFDNVPGKTIAYRWYASGCRTLDDLREGKNGVTLSSAMEIGLRYYEGKRRRSLFLGSASDIDSKSDINTRMPREEAETIFNLIEPIGLWSSFRY